MGELTHIAWTDSTVNFWEGCTKVSPGCAHCYAEARDQRMMIEPVIHWGKGAPRRKSKSAVKQAFSLNRKPWIGHYCGLASGPESGEMNCCALCSTETDHEPIHRRRIFSLSLGDIFDPEVPVEMLAEALDTIRQCDKVYWLLLTKRPELWRQRLSLVSGQWAIDCLEEKPKHEQLDWVNSWLGGTPPANVWVGTSVENQEMADKRISELLKIPAKVRFLSCEPLLEELRLMRWLAQCKCGHGHGFTACPNYGGVAETCHQCDCKQQKPMVDWVIAGAESGPNARPMEIAWMESIATQCSQAGVPLFIKQDNGTKSGMQGRIPDSLWGRKEFPNL